MKNCGFFPLLAIAASLLMNACATSPRQPPTEADAGTLPPAELDAAVAEAARGYDQVVKDGERLFCRRELPVGSKVMTTLCFTETQLREQIVNARKFRHDAMQQGRRCAEGPTCPQT